MTFEVIVLAAGKGTRMQSREPKVMQDLAGRSLFSHVMTTAAGLQPSHIHVVHGHDDGVLQRVVQQLSGVNWVCQDQQLGTAHAVLQALPAVNPESDVLVLYGDVPLIKQPTLASLVAAVAGRNLVVLTAHVPEPGGYGRVVRGRDGSVARIVEERDANEDEKAICEINTGFIAAPATVLSRLLERIGNENDQGEYYLTDAVGHAVESGTPVLTHTTTDIDEVSGVNTAQQLARLERAYQARQAEELMRAGLCLRDPIRFDLRGTMEFGTDCMIDVNVLLVGHVVLGNNVTIGTNCTVVDSELGDGVSVKPNSVIEGARVGSDCSIGPFARLRSGTVLAKGARVGNFVELKETRMGEGSKANHLAYVGDAEIGRNVNIGAGVITCNYDGANKHKTLIGDDAFIGSDSQLVAPVEVGPGATVGAGSTLTGNAPAGKLTLSRSKQVTRDNWQRPQKKDQVK
ncbi:MAG TPA: UDP-N-acetylglucosamine diphosphorylase/glucosamine-1-phosphate N-acetyltransferase [Gammaproteobacteria bacterium]|nr:UDP-N-acetylglucosamine diphosphorylase/glucosamine-1-phosphate N-acetyltransferase [Gammaproteobacteria bacterium]